MFRMMQCASFDFEPSRITKNCSAPKQIVFFGERVQRACQSIINATPQKKLFVKIGSNSFEEPSWIASLTNSQLNVATSDQNLKKKHSLDDGPQNCLKILFVCSKSE